MRSKRPLGQINMVPFIDVLLVLLVLVLVVASFSQKRKFDMQLPQGGPSDKKPTKALVLQISKDNRYFFEQEQITIDQLCKKIAGLDRAKEHVRIAGDNRSSLGAFVAAIECFKQANFDAIEIETAP